jgi:hypothetical protein
MWDLLIDILISAGITACLMAFPYLAACAGASERAGRWRWLTLREWWGS